MGLFDSIMIPCPNCGHEDEFQSKGAEYPLMREYRLGDDIPRQVLEGLNPIEKAACEVCSARFIVSVKLNEIKVHPTIRGKHDLPPYDGQEQIDSLSEGMLDEFRRIYSRAVGRDDVTVTEAMLNLENVIHNERANTAVVEYELEATKGQLNTLKEAVEAAMKKIRNLDYSGAHKSLYMAIERLE